MITPIIMRDFLHYYGYDEATERGCETIYHIWERSKAKLLEKFRKHPNWDEENLAIVFKEDEYERGFDASAFRPFMNWVYEQVDRLQYDDKENHVLLALDYIQMNCSTQFITAEQAERINSICLSPDLKKVSEGLKLTKAIQRLCVIAGLDKIKDVRQAHENTDRLKDFGFNYHFMQLADRINPTKYKRITVISLNPLDYWGMSFGYKWASCHTIDKWHKRLNLDPSHHYSGCYSAGTESYMLDSSSVIFYVVNEDYKGNTYYDEDKMNRVVFCLNDNASMILESRVYPDGRDGGDASLAAQFRSNMQKVVCDLWDLNNYWNVKKGTEVCRENTVSCGPHYKDYLQYGDCNVSFNKDECLTFPKIHIGHNAICPGCGTEHYGEKNIMCFDCGNDEDEDDYTECEKCGCTIHTNSDDYIYTGDCYYCSEECANNDGYYQCWDDDEWYYEDDVYLCEDDGRYHNDRHCYRDDYDDYYYSGSPCITTCDGYCFSCEENAKEMGYREDYFSGKWYKEDTLEYDEYENVYFSTYGDCIETEDGKYFATVMSAMNAGYVETVDIEWISKDKAIEIDGDYYSDEDAAIKAGYVKNEDNEWVEREVLV